MERPSIPRMLCAKMGLKNGTIRIIIDTTNERVLYMGAATAIANCTGSLLPGSRACRLIQDSPRGALRTDCLEGDS